MAKKRYRYSFAKRRHSAGGITSTVFAGVSLGLFCIACISSMVFHGKAGMYLGLIGLMAIGVSIYGFVIGLKSFSEKNRDQLFCKAGAVGNGILMIIWLALFLVGIS